jgi:hypothetical protein
LVEQLGTISKLVGISEFLGGIKVIGFLFVFQPDLDAPQQAEISPEAVPQRSRRELAPSLSRLTKKTPSACSFGHQSRSS